MSGDVGAEVAAVDVTPDEIDLLVFAAGPDADYEALIEAVEQIIAARVEVAKAEALREALSGVTTHNGTPVTPKNLRWAATHEALCRSYIFDVLTGLAAALNPGPRP